MAAHYYFILLFYPSIDGYCGVRITPTFIYYFKLMWSDLVIFLNGFFFILNIFSIDF